MIKYILKKKIKSSSANILPSTDQNLHFMTSVAYQFTDEKQLRHHITKTPMIADVVLILLK